MSLGTILLIILVLALVGINPNLAPQQILGIWSQQRHWTGVDHCSGVARPGQTVTHHPWVGLGALAAGFSRPQDTPDKPDDQVE